METTTPKAEYEPLSWCGADAEEQDNAIAAAKANYDDMEPAERAAVTEAQAWEWSANLWDNPSVAERVEYCAYLLDLCQPSDEDGGDRMARFLQQKASAHLSYVRTGPSEADLDRVREAAHAAWAALPPKACLYYLTREGGSDDPRWCEVDDALLASVPADLRCYESLHVSVRV